MTARRRVVIIGAGQAAAVAARTLRRRGFDGSIDLIGAEKHPPYQRPPLSKEYLADGDQDELYLLSESWRTKNEVTLHLGVPAEVIHPVDRAVGLSDGQMLPANAVLIATGGRARRLPRVEGERIHYLRTLEDADRLRPQLVAGARLIVIGGGFIGSEVAATAKALGVDVTIVEALGAPLQQILGREIGDVCAAIHRSHGVTLRLGEPVESVQEDEDGVFVTTSSCRLEGDLAVIGVGIVPNVELAVRSGVRTDNGVLVDEYCRTDVPNVFATGDVANHYHPLFGERVRVEHFDNANKHAACAAYNILGSATPFTDPHWFWSDQYELNLQYAGHARAWDQVLIRGSVENFDFCALYLRDGLIRAVFAVGRGDEVAAAKELIANRVEVAHRLLTDDDTDLAELAQERVEVISR
jgi:3-phenylpropionate/trans-cinnamate dioxygenase ferredoxin reductase component